MELLSRTFGLKVVDLVDPEDGDISAMTPLKNGIEVEIFPSEEVLFPTGSFSLCLRKYKEFGRYIDSMPFFSSDWNEFNVKTNKTKSLGFGYGERFWPNPSGLASGKGCK